MGWLLRAGAPHIVHGPLQVPDAQYAKFSFIDNPSRQKYHSMVNWIDAAIGRVVDDLKTSGLYEDTLICFNADNGGPLPTGNNWPLKGGKFSNCAPHPQAGICQCELSEEARFGSPSFKPSSRAPKARASV